MRTAIALSLCVILTGCMSASHKRPYAAVANEATVAASDSKAVYQTAQQTYYDEQADELAATYTTKGYTPGQVSALIASKDLQARIVAIDTVNQYGQLLNRALGDHKMGNAKQQQGSSSKKNTSNVYNQSTVFSAANTKAMGDAVSELGRIMADYEVARHLPKAVKEADPSIQTLTGLLIADLGQQGQLGIRNEVFEAYNNRIILQDQFIKKNSDKMSAVECREQIQKLLTLEREQKEADDAIVKAEQELKQVADLNHALATEAK